MPRRRQQVAAPPPRSEVPPEIAVGAVVGVWGDDLLAAYRQYSAGRRQWLDEAGLTVAEGVALAPVPRSPVQDEGAVARLQRLGLGSDDLPALRRRAEERLSR